MSDNRLFKYGYAMSMKNTSVSVVHFVTRFPLDTNSSNNLFFLQNCYLFELDKISHDDQHDHHCIISLESLPAANH